MGKFGRQVSLVSSVKQYGVQPLPWLKEVFNRLP